MAVDIISREDIMRANLEEQRKILSGEYMIPFIKYNKEINNNKFVKEIVDKDIKDLNELLAIIEICMRSFELYKRKAMDLYCELATFTQNPFPYLDKIGDYISEIKEDVLNWTVPVEDINRELKRSGISGE